MSFDIRTRDFRFEFRHDQAVAAPTELYMPDYQYPHGYSVEVSDGTYETGSERQTLVYRHTAARSVHSIRVKRLR
jgi:hypothetical protein